MAKIEIYFPDLKRLQQALTKSGPEGVKVAARALRNEAQEAFAASQDEVPVDTSALKQSGRIRPEVGVFERGDEVYVELSYGSTAVDYAAAVHERLDAYHAHGKSKYLEGPMLRQVNGIAGRIADKVERATKGMLR
jgi:hypothetical protein